MNRVVINSLSFNCSKKNNLPLDQNWDDFYFYRIDATEDINNLDYRRLPHLQNPLIIWNNELVTLATNILIVGRNIQEQVIEELNIHFCSNDLKIPQKLKPINDLLTNLNIIVNDNNMVNVFFVTDNLPKDYFCLNIKPNINFYYINSRFEDVSINSKIDNQKIKFDHILFDTSVIKFISYASIIRDSRMLLKIGGIVHIPDLLKDEEFFNLEPRLLPKNMTLTIEPINNYRNYYKLKIPYGSNVTVEEQKNLLIRHLKELDRLKGRISKPIKFMSYNGLETNEFEYVYELMDSVLMAKYSEIISKIINNYRMEKISEVSGAYRDVYPLYNDNYELVSRETFYIKAKKIENH